MSVQTTITRVMPMPPVRIPTRRTHAHVMLATGAMDLCVIVSFNIEFNFHSPSFIPSFLALLVPNSQAVFFL